MAVVDDDLNLDFLDIHHLVELGWLARLAFASDFGERAGNPLAHPRQGARSVSR